ncbi:MAG: hypothetical protein R3C68_01895 [Myxococcota bacterium]
MKRYLFRAGWGFHPHVDMTGSVAVGGCNNAPDVSLGSSPAAALGGITAVQRNDCDNIDEDGNGGGHKGMWIACVLTL